MAKVELRAHITPVRELVRQVPPLAARPQQVQHCIDHFPQIQGAGPPRPGPIPDSRSIRAHWASVRSVAYARRVVATAIRSGTFTGSSRPWCAISEGYILLLP